LKNRYRIGDNGEPWGIPILDRYNKPSEGRRSL
jgi:hypothetical protein